MEGGNTEHTQERKVVPEKWERLQEIFSLLGSVPPATSQDEAYALLKNTFESVEGKYYPRFSSRFQEEFTGKDLFKMRVEGIDQTIDDGVPASVAVIYADKHYTFIGNNGSLEIQKGDRDVRIKGNPHNEIVFEKKGADGKGVWD